MKITHKLCTRIDGPQFLRLSWFTAKNHSLQTYQPAVYSLCLSYFRSKKNASGKNQNLEGKDGAYLKVDVPQRTNVPKGCRTILIKLEITFERWLSKFRFPMAGNHGGLKI